MLFPASPQVKFNVFALHQKDQDGVSKEYTLVNFEDEKVFEAIRNKLQSLWDSSPDAVINSRNKLLNTKIRIRATGTFNVVDPGQANPQIMLAGPDSITLVGP